MGERGETGALPPNPHLGTNGPPDLPNFVYARNACVDNRGFKQACSSFYAPRKKMMGSRGRLAPGGAWGGAPNCIGQRPKQKKEISMARELVKVFCPVCRRETWQPGESENKQPCPHCGEMVRLRRTIRSVMAGESSLVLDGDESVGKDSGRDDLRFDLIPPGPLEYLVRAFGRNADSYGADNWKTGVPFTAAYSAMMSHVQEWRKGHDLDDETGLPHLALALFWIFALIWYGDNLPDLDDRGPGIGHESVITPAGSRSGVDWLRKAAW
jgi:predicted RNA-binding Zn-ribbon protein involved in translation (DUF1610 family)